MGSYKFLFKQMMINSGHFLIWCPVVFSFPKKKKHKHEKYENVTLCSIALIQSRDLNWTIKKIMQKSQNRKTDYRKKTL